MVEVAYAIDSTPPHACLRDMYKYARRMYSTVASTPFVHVQVRFTQSIKPSIIFYILFFPNVIFDELYLGFLNRYCQEVSARMHAASPMRVR